VRPETLPAPPKGRVLRRWRVYVRVGARPRFAVLQTRVRPRPLAAPASNRPFAVVTGASRGIGLELAKQFAAHGFDLLVAADDRALAAAATTLRGHGGGVDALRVDLATHEGVDELYAGIVAAARPVDAIAINAGIGPGVAFGTGTGLHRELKLIDRNVRSTVHLAKHVVRDMVARGQGRILFAASTASTMPGSFQAVHDASKSFVQSFALALGNEVRDTGVTVTSLMPGPTEAEFCERVDMLDTKVRDDVKDDPADVAREGFEALMAGRERVASASRQTKLQGPAGRVRPDSAAAEVHGAMAEPGSAKDD
jgi:short-subunit dehydrogenase